jgi:peroxiredoxin
MGLDGVSAHGPRRKSFLLLFFKKEALACLTPQEFPAITTLKSRLDDLLASRRASESWDAAYQEIVATLSHNGMLDAVLPVGAPFPSFALPSAEGRLVSLAAALSRGPVVLGFFRGAWCPFCRLMLAALTEALSRIEAAGGTLLALTPETGGLPLTMKRYHGAAFEVLADVDFGVGLMAGVVFRIPPLYRERLVASGLEFPQRHGNGAWCLPVPATFIIRPDGIIAERFVNVDFAVRPEPEEIIAALDRLR